MIPLGTDRPLDRRAIVTPILVLANIVVFLGLALAGLGGDAAAQQAAEIKRAGMVIGGEDFRWYQLVTSAFLHADWMHLLGNMVFLWAFGRAVEDRMGHIGFSALYLAGAVIPAGIHALSGPEQVPLVADGVIVAYATQHIPALGASAAISAVTGAFLAFFPRTRIRVLNLIFVIGLFNVPSWWFISLQVVLNLFGAFGAGDSGVGYGAHLAGYAVGLVIAMILLWLKLVPRESYDLFSMIRQAKRRSEFRAAASETQARAQRRVGAPAAAHRRNKARPEAEPPESPADRELTAARADIAAGIEQGDLDAASRAYLRFAKAAESGLKDRRGVLRKDHLEAVASHMYRQQQYAPAAEAFARYTAYYPDDRDTPTIRLLLGRVLSEALGKPDEAARHYERAARDLSDPELRETAQAELEALIKAHPSLRAQDEKS